MNATQVSRIIRRAGVAVLPSGSSRSAQGVRVSKSTMGEVCVSVDFAVEAIAARRAGMVIEALEDAGLTVRVNSGDPTILNVSSAADA